MKPYTDELVRNLRSNGNRLTPQREVILSVLASSERSESHLCADEIIRRVRRVYPHLNKSVVYRNLDLLTRLGLVSRIDPGQGRVEYELHHHPHHHHLVCRGCNSTHKVESPLFARLEQDLMREHSFAADIDHIAIFGLCRRCRMKKRKASQHPHKLAQEAAGNRQR